MTFTFTSSWLAALGFGFMAGLLLGAWCCYRIGRYLSRRAGNESPARRVYLHSRRRRPEARQKPQERRRQDRWQEGYGDEIISALVGLGCRHSVARAAVADLASHDLVDFDSGFKAALEAVKKGRPS